MDFGSLVTLALIVGGFIVVRRFTFRQRALSFGRRQARALRDLAKSFPEDNPGAMALDDDETFIYRTGQDRQGQGSFESRFWPTVSIPDSEIGHTH